MCTATQQAKITSISQIIAAVILLVGTLVLNFAKLKRRMEFRISLALVFLTLITLCLEMATIGVMFTSPLFSMDHNRALSKEFTQGLPFGGYG